MRYQLLFDAERLPEIRDLYQSHPRFEDLREEAQQRDLKEEEQFLKKELRSNDHLEGIARLLEILSGSLFNYLMNESEEALKHSKCALNRLMEMPTWDYLMNGTETLGNLRAPRAAHLVAQACDWLGDAIEDDERRNWLTILGERGCEPCYRTLHGMRHLHLPTAWRYDPESTVIDKRFDSHTDMTRRNQITADTNLCVIPAAGLTFGAIVYHQEFGESEKTERWLEMAENRLSTFREIYQTDGSYHEEINYGNHTTYCLAEAVTLLSRFGRKNLLDLVNWSGYCRFALNYSLPTRDDLYDIANFGDSGNKVDKQRRRSPLAFWTARSQRDGQAQWLGLNRALDTQDSVFWFDPNLPEESPNPGPHLYISHLHRVIARTGWETEDLGVALRSGPPSNHEHGDRNSIIIKSYGEKLIVDPMRPPYPYNQPGWEMRTTRGHSAILIDGEGHEYVNGVEGTNPSRAYAYIEEHQNTSHFAYWKSVATQPYRLVDRDVREVTRSVVVLYASKTVVLVDAVKKFENTSAVTARFFINNLDGQGLLDIQPDGFITQRPGGKLKARFLASVPFQCQQGKPFVEGEWAEHYPFCDTVMEGALDSLLISVMTTAPTQGDYPEVQIEGNAHSARISDSRCQVGIREGVVSIT